MQIPVFRLVMMLVFLRRGSEEDTAEAQIAHVALFVLSWALTEVTTPVARWLISRAQARRGEVTWTAARQHSKLRPVSLGVAATLSTFAMGALIKLGHTQMPAYIVATTAVLPLVQASAWPSTSPVAIVLALSLAGLWFMEGVRPLSVGLFLFNAQPAWAELLLQPLAARPRLRAFSSCLLWWVALCAVAPVLVVGGLTMLSPAYLAWLSSPATHSNLPPGLASALPALWHRLQVVLGAGRGANDPWRVLGISRGSSAREVRKRVRELSLLLHPDKVGTNPVTHARYLAVVAAADKLTRGRGGSASATDAAGLAREDVARDAAHRCVESIFVIGAWIATAALGAAARALGVGAAAARAAEAAARHQNAASAAAASVLATGGTADDAAEAAGAAYRASQTETERADAERAAARASTRGRRGRQVVRRGATPAPVVHIGSSSGASFIGVEHGRVARGLSGAPVPRVQSGLEKHTRWWLWITGVGAIVVAVLVGQLWMRASPY